MEDYKKLQNELKLLKSQLEKHKKLLQFSLPNICIDCLNEKIQCYICDIYLCKKCKETANLKIKDSEYIFENLVCIQCSSKYEICMV